MSSRKTKTPVNKIETQKQKKQEETVLNRLSLEGKLPFLVFDSIVSMNIGSWVASVIIPERTFTIKFSWFSVFSRCSHGSDIRNLEVHVRAIGNLDKLDESLCQTSANTFLSVTKCFDTHTYISNLYTPSAFMYSTAVCSFLLKLMYSTLRGCPNGAHGCSSIVSYPIRAHRHTLYLCTPLRIRLFSYWQIHNMLRLGNLY